MTNNILKLRTSVSYQFLRETETLIIKYKNRPLLKVNKKLTRAESVKYAKDNESKILMNVYNELRRRGALV